MSTNISENALRNFLVKTFRADKLTQQQAQKYGIDETKFTEANQGEKDDNFLDIDEILDDKDLYAQFATMCAEEHDKAVETDSEKEKEKATKVQDKGKSKA